MSRVSKAQRLARSLNDAMECHRRGQLAEAERLYRQILRRAPGYADALHLCGMAAFQQGDAARGASMVEQAVARMPQSGAYRYTLGEIRRAQGQLEVALRCYDAALERDHGLVDAHYQRGNTLLALNRYDQAVRAFRHALELRPNDAEALNNLGNALAAAGEQDAAIDSYRAAAEKSPEDAGIWANLGHALLARGRYSEAEKALRTGLERAPDMLPSAVSLARLIHETGRPADAVELLQEQIRVHEGSPQALCDVGQALMTLEAYALAESLFRRVLERVPDDGTATAGLAMCLQHTGRFDEAAALYQNVIAAHPDFGGAHYALANNRAFRPDEAYLARLRKLTEDHNLDTHTRVQLWFAVGRFEEAEDRANAAFAAYREGNQLHAREHPFDEAAFRGHFERIRSVFDEDFFRTHQGIGIDAEIPVFVLGMPRSGTTLVEQIISAHPQAFGAGELSDFRRMSRTLPHDLGSAQAFPECARDLSPASAAALAHRYVQGLRQRAPEALRVTDKLPFNFAWLGLIAVLLPRAKVIHVRREPADTCLSCYFQLFDEGMRFAYDLTSLGHAYRIYDELMKHWRKVLPLPVLDVDYEQVVADQEGQSRRIIDFIGLPWDERCLQFYRAERGVRTASFWQVRQPLYRSSVGRWRRYAGHLEPLMEALGPLAPDNRGEHRSPPEDG